MKSRTLLRSRGSNTPIESYHGNRADYLLKQAQWALSIRSHRLAGELADESRQWRELGTKHQSKQQ